MSAKAVVKASSKERLMTVLVAPHVSEKSAIVAEKANQIVFRVRRDSTKPEIKAAWNSCSRSRSTRCVS